VAHALQHLNAWLEREAVAGERGGGGFELSIPGRETVKPSWEADLLSKRERICRGTGSSNPSPSSGESIANPTSTVSLAASALDAGSYRREFFFSAAGAGLLAHVNSSAS
jgi:hypothetical protein